MNKESSQKVGYARVSTTGQQLDSQIDALYNFGCTQVFSDKVSGVREERPGFSRLMDYLREGDFLVITELSRMTRSLKHLLQLVEDLEKRMFALASSKMNETQIHIGRAQGKRIRKVGIISLRENLDTSTATGRCFISIMGAISQMERELKSDRAKAGREVAKVRGRTGGRPRTEPRKLEQARILYENSNQTATEVCQAVGIGRRTFFSHLAQRRQFKP